ncbi:LysR family transcriptional regulator [Thalassovita sp.]|uniref:LysR family transcriptional regulator n=1 Tax=Thalassovita sp. TaxID=1979401 RepID=UPI0029DE72A7|nr:LysR family transcriptional regulator [Thalassovita sp.]
MVNFRTFDLNLLRVLDALLDCGSTVAAARRLHMSQPAVSAALARLRQTLQNPLFVRQGRGLIPTDFALSLQPALRDVLTRTESFLSGPDQFDPTTADVTFKISGMDFFSLLLMPRLADHLSRIAPLVRVQQVSLVPDDYIQSLESSGVDVALIPQTEQPAWVDQKVVMQSRFTVIARDGNPRLRQAGLNAGDIIPLDLFCDIGHILCSPDGKLKGLGDVALARQGRQRRVVMTLPVFSGVCNAVAASDLIALLPNALARHVAPQLGLVLYRAPVTLPAVTLSMVWHRRHSHAPAHRWLRDQLQQALAPLDDPEPLP